MSASFVQNSAIQSPFANGVGHNEETKSADSPQSSGTLGGVQHVKDALSANSEGLTDAELNVLSHAISQLTAAFSVQQAFSVNVTAFEQLEKSLGALKELLKDVEKARGEMKEGLRSIILSEALSAVFGGLITTKAVHTAARQLRFTNFANNVGRNNNQGMPELDVRVLGKGGNAPDAASRSGETLASTKPTAGPLDAGYDLKKTTDTGEAAGKPMDVDEVPNNPANQKKAVEAEEHAQGREEGAKRDFEKEGEAKALLDQFEDARGWSVNPIKSVIDDERLLSKLPNSNELSSIKPDTASMLGKHAVAKANNLANVVQIEMQAARLVQQFAHTFKNLGETQQSLAQMELNADSSVYSNQTEYWSTLMGTFQRLAQEYQSAFQSDHGALDQDVAQANMMAQYVYRS